MEGEKKLVRFFPENKPYSFGEVIYADSDGFHLNLNKEGSSWVDGFMCPLRVNEDFGDLWSIKPEERGSIKIMGKTVSVPRTQQSYGKGYWFSGMEHTALPVPGIVQKYLDWANTTPYSQMYRFPGFDEVLINWYENGAEYIGAHSDDESGMRVGVAGETIVLAITFQERPPNRIFRVKPKAKLGKTTEERKQLGKERSDIEMVDGLVLVMGGRCQKTHTHQIPKTKLDVGRRISITFRSFK